MVSRKELAKGEEVVVVPASPPPVAQQSMIPTQLRFPLVVISNLALSALCYSFSSEFAAGDLSSVSRSINEWSQVGGLLFCRVLELALGWWGNYDSMSF